ncbi:MAG: TonB-system energizer ExbB [Sulfuricurvum sp.]
MENIKLYIDVVIIGSLGLMSFVSLWLSIERMQFYKKIKLRDYKTRNQIEIALTNNLSTIASIGSNSPYVGLLGTVVGIMIVFYDMGMNASYEISVIVVGLSLALKATAIGIAVAIFSMMLYSAFLRKTDVLLGEWEDEINQAK